jgi:hypothetical protein
MAIVPKILVFCRTQFIGFHFWKDAPDAVGFLREPHRHVFHVEAAVNVVHDNRAIEFITLRRELDIYIHNRKVVIQVGEDEEIVSCLANSFETAYPFSCEMIATAIMNWLEKTTYNLPVYVEVSEDGENGARVYYEHIPVEDQ